MIHNDSLVLHTVCFQNHMICFNVRHKTKDLSAGSDEPDLMVNVGEVRANVYEPFRQG